MRSQLLNRNKAKIKKMKRWAGDYIQDEQDGGMCQWSKTASERGVDVCLSVCLSNAEREEEKQKKEVGRWHAGWLVGWLVDDKENLTRHKKQLISFLIDQRKGGNFVDWIFHSLSACLLDTQSAYSIPVPGPLQQKSPCFINQSIKVPPKFTYVSSSPSRSSK